VVPTFVTRSGGEDSGGLRKGKDASIERERSTAFSVIAGQVLRQVRLSRSLSLRQVTIRSHGRFKPSSVASYERGERQISLERLFALAEVYGAAAESIVAIIASRLGSSEDDERLGAGASEERRTSGAVP
jgi:transcriptional regulator with XRE-family HTH domain